MSYVKNYQLTIINNEIPELGFQLEYTKITENNFDYLLKRTIAFWFEIDNVDEINLDNLTPQQKEFKDECIKKFQQKQTPWFLDGVLILNEGEGFWDDEQEDLYITKKQRYWNEFLQNIINDFYKLTDKEPWMLRNPVDAINYIYNRFNQLFQGCIELEEIHYKRISYLESNRIFKQEELMLENPTGKFFED